MSNYTDTTGELARQARVTAATVRKYANEGLLEYVTASNGTRLFREDQAARVRQLLRESVSRRGRRPAGY